MMSTENIIDSEYIHNISSNWGGEIIDVVSVSDDESEITLSHQTSNSCIVTVADKLFSGAIDTIECENKKCNNPQKQNNKLKMKNTKRAQSKPNNSNDGNITNI